MRHLYSGKVREIYELDDEHLLFVTTDRISAFDVVMSEPIPGKGRVLTALTAFWAGLLADVASTHLVSLGMSDVGDRAGDGAGDADRHGDGLDRTFAEGRTMVVRRAEMLPIECIVRGYLSGSAWAEYKRAGTMHGEPLPPGMRQSEKLPEPVFTPSTKAAVGHDENISFEGAVALVGDKMAAKAREICLDAYRKGSEHAARKGIIIADTKFELGLVDGELAICDEVLTPDSSRFWPENLWQPGTAPVSFDKQPLRDWLEGTGWGKTPPPPPLPPEVVEATRARYVEAYELLSGLSFADWPGTDNPPG